MRVSTQLSLLLGAMLATASLSNALDTKPTQAAKPAATGKKPAATTAAATPAKAATTAATKPAAKPAAQPKPATSSK